MSIVRSTCLYLLNGLGAARNAARLAKVGSTLHTVIQLTVVWNQSAPCLSAESSFTSPFTLDATNRHVIFRANCCTRGTGWGLTIDSQLTIMHLLIAPWQLEAGPGLLVRELGPGWWRPRTVLGRCIVGYNVFVAQARVV
jgi:hypothetical protein